MDLIGIGAGSFGLALTGAVVPGPLLAVVVAQVARQGPRAAWLAVAAHSGCELLVVLGLRSGLLRAMTAPAAVTAISGAGAAVLVVLGALTARLAAKGNSLEAGSSRGRRAAWAALSGGLVATALNPYWLLWWATIAPAYMVRFAAVSGGALAVFYLTHIAGDFAWYVPIAYALRGGQKRLSGRFYNGVLWVSAAFLVMLGVSFAVDAARGLLPQP